MCDYSQVHIIYIICIRRYYAVAAIRSNSEARSTYPSAGCLGLESLPMDRYEQTEETTIGLSFDFAKYDPSFPRRRPSCVGCMDPPKLTLLSHDHMYIYIYVYMIHTQIGIG